jgi:cell division protein DivIC
MKMHYVKPVLRLLKNKYVLAITAFLIWMFFFDPKDWGLIAARTNKLKELKESERHLTLQISDTKKELSLLKTNAQTIEKYAREKFYMKKDNEDLFIVKGNNKE